MDDAAVRATLAAVWRHGMRPILCVGESLATRESGEHVSYVTAQLRAALEGAADGPLCVAYEPIWAIGTGVVAEVPDVLEMMAVVRAALPEARRDEVPVLYGGSVNREIAPELAAVPGCDGFLVGGASLRAEEFCAIVAAGDGC
jgi:triosephosphate isomerase